MKRVVSLLPSATDIVGALGLASWLVGVSHECDWPPEVRRLPRLTRSALPAGLPPAQTDALVDQSLHRHRSLYTLDVDRLRQLKPDLILTQELCDVCAVSYEQVQGAVRWLQQDGEAPAILSLEPRTLDDVLQTIEVVADQLGERQRGQDLVADLSRQLARLRRQGEAVAPKPTVLVLEWPEPPWIGGHWVPDLVAAAGGRNAPQQALRRGAPSIRVSWAEVQANDPDLIVLAPCGYGEAQAAQALQDLAGQPAWEALRAVQAGRVYPVNANDYWSRPGPRLVDGIEELQRLLLTSR
jgi:iron complex transport system substrate-binding protein